MKASTKWIFTVNFFFFIIAADAYTEQNAAWKGKIEYENNVKIVKNPKDPMLNEAPFDLIEDLTITDRGGDEGFFFQQIWHVAVDDDENIYVPDSRASNIKVFDKNGNYLRTIARKGRGPGELMYPFGIQITPQKEILVVDRTLAQIIFFDLEGNFLRQFSTNKMIRFMLPKMDSKGDIIAGYMLREEKFIAKITKFDSELNPIFDLVSVPAHTQPPVISFFERQRLINLHWDIFEDDRIIWGEVFNYEFYIHSPEGGLIQIIVTDYDGVRITDEDKKNYIKEEFGEDFVLPSQIKLEFPKYLPPFRQFTCDEKGRIIARSYEEVKDNRGIYFDVFDGEGRYLARIILELIPRCWRNDKLYATGQDDEGNIVVKRYRVIWK
jgi:hypothetical protein